MKKFLIISGVLFIFFFVFKDFIFMEGLYRRILKNDEIEISFTTNNKEIRHKNNEFIIKGVTVKSSVPNWETTQYKPSKNDYFKWLTQIKEMGANTVRLIEILDSDFYEALYEFNKDNRDPIYIIQGITLTDYMNNNSEDAYDENYKKELSERAKLTVDAIRGNEKIILNRGYGIGLYKKDVSDWLIGYIIGDEWNSYTIAYTNNEENAGFKGKYFETTENANAFESLLASQMDEIVDYEATKYNKQSLISYSNSSKTDPFDYEDYYAGQLSKFVTLNIDNIKTTENLKSGYFASYSLGGIIDDYYKYFSDDQNNKLKEAIENYEEIKKDYSKLLSKYHTMPVIISSYGYSTSRGIDSSKNGGPLTEKEQGEKLINTYREIIAAGCSGAVIDSWNDNWNNSAWNTNYAVDINNSNSWADAQTVTHGYGILSYDIKNVAAYLDGDKSEWSEKDLISSNDNIDLYMKSDEKYLYFMVDGVNTEDNIILPIDITPKSGSLVYSEKSMEFDRNIDFIIDINGEKEGKVLVHDYYNSLRENYLMNIKGIDPFVERPYKYSSNFDIVQMILKKDKIIEKDSIIYDINGVPIKQVIYNEVHDTGRLTYGNSDPESEDYNSLSDIKFGDDFVEIRIPWQILNFYNPAKRQIHDDYYENYGVKPITIKNIYVGVGLPNDKVSLGEYKLKSWKKVDFKERLKQSYEIIKECWKGE